jgi:hypothetical protein
VIREQYAVALGEIGDPIDTDELSYAPSADAACVLARFLLRETGEPRRVVRITEVAFFAAPTVKP